MSADPQWKHLVGGVGPTAPMIDYATAKGSRKRKRKPKPPSPARDTPPVPEIRGWLAALGRWSRLSSWWLYSGRALALIFPETARFALATKTRTHIYGFA